MVAAGEVSLVSLFGEPFCSVESLQETKADLLSIYFPVTFISLSLSVYYGRMRHQNNGSRRMGEFHDYPKSYNIWCGSKYIHK